MLSAKHVVAGKGPPRFHESVAINTCSAILPGCVSNKKNTERLSVSMSAGDRNCGLLGSDHPSVYNL